MTEMLIKDGAGKCNTMRVDSELRAHVASITRTERDAAINKGWAYLFVSGLVTLTNDTESGVLYIKNNDSKDLVISDIYCSFGTSTVGSGNGRLKVYTEIGDTSTLVSDAAAARATNLKISDTTAFTSSGIAYDGGTGSTIVGGNSIHTILIMEESIIDFSVPFHIPTSSNMAFTITAPTGNTSMDVMLAVTGYYLDTELPE